MTEENKKNILDYITCNFNTTKPSNEEIFLEQEAIDENKWKPFLPISWNNFRFEGMVAPNETINNIGVLYGGYLDSNNQVKGIILLFDESFMPIKTIYKYDSGTDLRYIQYMKQAEDGTFYFIDDTAFSYSQKQQVMTSQKRFVMVNNFTLKNQVVNDYEIRIRASYIFTGNYVNFYCKNMYKDPNSSHYIFFGSVADNTSPNYDYRGLKIIGLKVNVGEANEWALYENITTGRLFGSAIATFDEDNVRYRCLSTNIYSNNNDLILYSKTYTGNPTNSVVVTINQYKPYIDDNYYKKQSVFLDYDNVYFVLNNQHWGISGNIVVKYIGLYKLNIQTSQLYTIYEKYLGDYDYCNLEAIYIDRCDTDIYIQYNTNIDSTGTTPKADYYFQRLVNDVWKPQLVQEQAYFQYSFRSIFVKSNYNLLQAYLYGVNPRIVSAWFYYQIKEDYNSANYNSTEYNDYNSMIGTKGRIYVDSKLAFARNLYNRTSWNNSTTSTIQIPNGYLNNISIQPKQLLSYSNNTINNDTEEIVKNNYESVLLNFINSITVLDEDTNTLYSNDANYVNVGINIGTKANSDTIRIGKVRFNYENGNKIFPIEWNDTQEGKETSFSIYVDNPITSIDFLSNDESFIYLTKEYDLEVGKTYTINQKIRIE